MVGNFIITKHVVTPSHLSFLSLLKSMRPPLIEIDSGLNSFILAYKFTCKMAQTFFFFTSEPSRYIKMQNFLKIPPEPKNIVKTKAVEKNGYIAQKMTEIWAI